MSEYYRNIGLHSLVVYDELKAHASVYRQLNLLLGNPVGREAYPGDTFYLHARLLERSAQMSFSYGYGSSTALPICEILQNNLSNLIPTNLISITDGQWFLKDSYAKVNFFPAVDLEKSVSRVGRKAQPKMVTWLVDDFRNCLFQYLRLDAIVKAGQSISPESQVQLLKGHMALGV